MINVYTRITAVGKQRFPQTLARVTTRVAFGFRTVYNTTEKWTLGFRFPFFEVNVCSEDDECYGVHSWRIVENRWDFHHIHVAGDHWLNHRGSFHVYA